MKKMNIIDSKSDLGFKKVFAERPHLLMSLLNNLLPSATLSLLLNT
jgi:hypothetical protein